MRVLQAFFVSALLCIAGCDGGGDEISGRRAPHFAPPAPAAAPLRLALVLGSGGARGFAHIGVLKALDENGIHPDLVIGSSVGAAVGALYAAGASPVELERRALRLKLLDVLELRMLIGGPTTGRGSTTSTDPSRDA